MVLPLLLAGGAALGGLSLFSDKAADKTVEVAGAVVEESFAAIGTGVVAAGSGMIKGLKEASKGHGVEITASITILALTYFFFKRYIQ
tara:strand:+ start:3037 stop:3300 length:264 start_codon:yes stop_codon:yes gene_type:complete